jgi:hypothetical protein
VASVTTGRLSSLRISLFKSSGTSRRRSSRGLRSNRTSGQKRAIMNRVLSYTLAFIFTYLFPIIISAQLNFPFQEPILDEIHSSGRAMGFGTPHLYPPSGRYLAEWWVLNDSGTIGPSKPATELDGVNRKGLLDADQICSW